MAEPPYIILTIDIGTGRISGAEGPGLATFGNSAPNLLGCPLAGALTYLAKRMGGMLELHGVAPLLDGLTCVPSQHKVCIRLPQIMVNQQKNDQYINEMRRLQTEWEQLPRQEPIALLLWGIGDLPRVEGIFGASALKLVMRHVGKQARFVADDGHRLYKVRNGDYLFLLPGQAANDDEVRRFFARLRKTIGKPVAIGDYQVSMAINAGVVRYPSDGTELDELLYKARQAAINAQAKGRNILAIYDRNTQVDLTKEMTLVADLHEAVRLGTLAVHYQPQVAVADGKMVGMEALLRWQHPVYGPVAPAYFIPLVERAGLAKPLTAWVLDQVCRQGRSWLDAGVDFGRIAVNISAGCFTGGWLNKTVQRILTETGLPPRFLEFEITENIEVVDAVSVRTMLTELRQKGITVAFDDFGIGYSSFKYLKFFPLDVVKIDRLFIADLQHNASSQIIVRTLIKLAADLGLTTVAEGVETAEQLRFLRAAGCDRYQGYLLSPPLPVHDIAMFVRRLTG